jgi:KDO2-lipid IV(A) lauroyltransferase
MRLTLKSIALFAYYLPTRENRIARLNLAQFFDEKTSEKIRKDMYLNWARSLEEILRVIVKGEDVDKFVTMAEGSREVLDEALQKRSGVIYFTAHMGNWELMAIYLARLGYDINTIAKESYDRRFTELIRRFREDNKVKCIFRNEDNIMERIENVLRSNGIMGFLIDQNTKVLSVDVNFIGRLAPTPVVPVRIMKRNNTPSIVGYIHRGDKKNIIEIKRLEYSHNEDERVILERINGIISEGIMKYPSEWIWIHNRWNIS